MSALPAGWAWVTLDEVADVQGGIQKQPKRRPTANKFPFLRVANVQRGSLDLADVHEVELFDGELERFRLKAGDLLVVEGNGSVNHIGRSAVWSGEIHDCVHQNHLIRVRPTSAVESGFLQLLWNSPIIITQIKLLAASTSGLHTLSVWKLQGLELPLPPLGEQRRISEGVEDNLTSLERAASVLRTSAARSQRLARSMVKDLVGKPWPLHWRITSVGEAGAVDLGRQRHPDWHNGSHMRPYLRVANVFENRLDLSDVMQMDFHPDVFARFKLSVGDILLNEGQSPHLLGRPAMYRGEPKDVAFTNSLIRFRANEEVLPEWALMVFRHYMHSGRFTKEVRITTNIAHLSSTRFKSIEFPIPPLCEQREILDIAHADIDYQVRLQSSLDAANSRTQLLRRALLSAACAGELIDQDPTDEPADVLLARIRADRTAVGPKPRKLRARKATTT